MLSAEQCLRAVDGQLLDVVHQRHPLVVPRPRIALGVLDVQMRGQTLEDRRRGVVLTGDEVERARVALAVGLDKGPDVWVGAFERLPRRPRRYRHAVTV